MLKKVLLTWNILKFFSHVETVTYLSEELLPFPIEIIESYYSYVRNGINFNMDCDRNNQLRGI